MREDRVRDLHPLSHCYGWADAPLTQHMGMCAAMGLSPTQPLFGWADAPVAQHMGMCAVASRLLGAFTRSVGAEE